VSDALLDAIRARPADDAPRLVYADALSDRGDPMGELIALQCRLARLPASAPDRVPLIARDLALRELVEARLPPVAPIVWERGFIVEITATPRQFVDAADVILDAAPLLERLVCHGGVVGRDVIALAATPALARVRSLDLGSLHIGDEAVRALAASPYVTSLETLRVSLCTIRRAAAELVTSPQLASLRALEIGQNYLDDASFRRIALPRLERLGANATNAGDDGVRTIAGSGLAAWDLDLSSNRIGTGGVLALARSRLRLRALDLSRNRLGQMAASVLVRAEIFRGLERLSLFRNQLGDEGARLLADSAELAGLVELDVRENRLSDAGRALLRARFGDRVRC
jgi:uncharacterized protein (TIGR02996 family)